MKIARPTIRGKCPECDRAVAFRDCLEATTVHKRTCQGCGTVWQVKRETLKNHNGIRMDQLTFSKLSEV